MGEIIVTTIHPNPLVALATVLCGLILGMALALSNWKSKLTIGGIATAASGAVTSISAEKFAALKQFIEGTTLLTPLLYGLDIAMSVFLVALGASTCFVFSVNFIRNKRRDDPEAFVKAARRAVSVFGSGLYAYAIAPPDLVSANKISELEKHTYVLRLLQKTLVHEIALQSHSLQHFMDSFDAVGRLLLQFSFGDGPDLQHFRMAFFERRGDRLEYLKAINNRDWTAHSMVGFDVTRSFMGYAISLDRPIVYPKDKKWNVPFSKRKSVRYKSFIILPVPCGQSGISNLGAITVDYTGNASVFTDRRIDELFALSQLVQAMYLLNVKGDKHEADGRADRVPARAHRTQPRN